MKPNRKIAASLTLTRSYTPMLRRAQDENRKAIESRYARSPKGRRAKQKYAQTHPDRVRLKAARWYEKNRELRKFQMRLERLLMRIVRAEEARGRFE